MIYDKLDKSELGDLIVNALDLGFLKSFGLNTSFFPLTLAINSKLGMALCALFLFKNQMGDSGSNQPVTPETICNKKPILVR